MKDLLPHLRSLFDLACPPSKSPRQSGESEDSPAADPWRRRRVWSSGGRWARLADPLCPWDPDAHAARRIAEVELGRPLEERP